MKILQVSPRYPPRRGGVETHVRALAERFVAEDHDVYVVTADAGPDVASQERRNGVTVQRYRGIAPDGAFHVAPGIARAVRKTDADIVHAHNYHSLPLLFAAIATDAPLVVTPHYHGQSANGLRNRLLSLYRPAGRWALRQATAVLAVSEWERNRLVSDFGVEASLVPNGIDTERFAEAEPVRTGTPTLLTVGRLAEYKGVQHAIRALAELPEWRLVVAGKGPYRTELDRIAERANVADRVEFRGFVDDVELAELYASATVYVSLSQFEAFGLTVGEALASGTPAVVRSERALTEWGNRSDCVGIDRVTSSAIADAIRTAWTLDAPAAPLPTWDTVAASVLNAYSEVL